MLLSDDTDGSPALSAAAKQEIEFSGDDGYSLNYFSDHYAIQKAARLGLDIEMADDLTLQLDIDSEDAYDRFVQQMSLAGELKLIPYDAQLITRRSKSGNHHVTIKLIAPLPIITRIMLQACLGSDIKRELLSYAGHLKGQEHPVLLFRPKEGQKNASDSDATGFTDLF